METLNFYNVALFFIVSQLLQFPSSYSQTIPTNFIQCISNDAKFSSSSKNVLYFPTNSSYTSLLYSTVQNKRFLNSDTAVKPLAIVKASTYGQVQATVKCGKQYGVPLRTRSGGHDYEGLSFRSPVPFVLLDLQNLNAVNVSVEENTAWVQSGAMLGELYYSIRQKSSKLGFSAGTCPSVGAGGHISGGGFGTLSRKYGLAADNVIDAIIVDANGCILDRKFMGEDVFWAIRGGGGGSFGVILSWKIRLLEVPPVVTALRVSRRVDQGATDLVYKWQTIGRNFSKDLFMRLMISPTSVNGGGRTIQISFETLYLGRADELVAMLNQNFPELGLRRQDCTEMSWIQSVFFFAYRDINNDLENLRARIPLPNPLRFAKATSDYVTRPLSKSALELVWKWCLQDQNSLLIFEPYGGRMDEIPANNLPFPHRKGVLFNIQYMMQWDNATESDYHTSWVRRMYEHMTPYVSKAPRRAYLNYKDLDLGVNKVDGVTSFSEAEQLWGSKYFVDNFKRLAMVKRQVDPQNFFKDEQSIPLF